MPLRMTGLIHRLRHLAKPGVSDSDADLLRRFSRGRDESAFAILVARHGPMVFGVCRRVLGNSHSAEDASQATFLVLARRAGSIERPDSLAGWLHGVAFRVASKARFSSRRRVPLEPFDRSDHPDDRLDPLSEASGREWLEILEEELQQLPETLRLALALCCLEGLSQEEAAQRLGCTTGSIRGRLERGRRRLHERLARRGLTLSAALALAEISHGVVSAALTAKIVRGAVTFVTGGRGVVSQQVIALAEGGLRAMFWTKMKVLMVVLVASGLIGTGTTWLAISTGKGDSLDRTPDSTRAAAAEADAKPKTSQVAAPSPGDKANAQDLQAQALRDAEKKRDATNERLELSRKERVLSDSIVRERETLVDLEAQLRDEEADARENRTPGEVELVLAREVARIKAESLKIESSKENAPVIQKMMAQMTEAEDSMRSWKEKRLRARKKTTERLTEIRRSVVRKEEAIRQLERSRDLVRNEIDQRFESAAVVAPANLPKATLQRLEIIQRELTELRRELRGLKSQPKE